MRLGIATATTIITSSKVVRCRKTLILVLKYFWVWISWMCLVCLKFLETWLLKVQGNDEQKWVQSVFAFECYICSSKPFMSVSLWLPSSKSDGSGLFFKLYSFEVLEKTYTEHVSRKLLVYSYSTELHKGLGKSWPLMFLPSDLVGPRMHITNKSFLHWTQWVTHT